MYIYLTIYSKNTKNYSTSLKKFQDLKPDDVSEGCSSLTKPGTSQGSLGAPQGNECPLRC